MKKYYLIPICLLLLVLVVACDMVHAEEAGTDPAAIGADKKVMTVGDSTLYIKDGAYWLVSPYGEDDYANCRTMRYFGQDGTVKTGYILISADRMITALSEEGVKTYYDRPYTKYTFYGDYLVMDGWLYDGNLNRIGMAHGEVASVTSPEEGGIVTFEADAEGKVYTYFHGDVLKEEPEEGNYTAHLHSVYGANRAESEDNYCITEEGMHLYTGDKWYQLPQSLLRDRFLGGLLAKEGTFYFLYGVHAENRKLSETLYREISYLYHSDAPDYFKMTESMSNFFAH